MRFEVAFFTRVLSNQSIDAIKKSAVPLDVGFLTNEDKTTKSGRYIRLPALLALNVTKGLILLGLGKILSTTCLHSIYNESYIRLVIER